MGRGRSRPVRLRAGLCGLVVLVAIVATVAVPADATATTTAPGGADSPVAHAFELNLAADPSDCTSDRFGINIGSCFGNQAGTTTSPFSGARVDWGGGLHGSGSVGISLLAGSSDILEGTMASRGSDSLAITSGNVQYWGATTGITTGTSKPAGQVDGPLRIDVQTTNQGGFTFRINGFLMYGKSSGTAVPTTTKLTALPVASPGQAVTYRATVSPTTKIAQSYGTFDFSVSGRARLGDNCYHPLEDNSGRAWCTVTFSDAGDYTVEAYFSGTSDRASSSATVPQVIDDKPYATTSVPDLRFPFLPGKDTLPQSVSLTWLGKLTVQRVDITGTGGFRVTDQDCTAPPQGRLCTVLVTVSATSGAPSGELVITDNASNSPQKVSLRA